MVGSAAILAPEVPLGSLVACIHAWPSLVCLSFTEVALLPNSMALTCANRGKTDYLCAPRGDLVRVAENDRCSCLSCDALACNCN